MAEKVSRERSILGPGALALIPGVLGAFILPLGPAELLEIACAIIAAIWWWRIA
jgi:hypothetical protein